MHLNGTRPIPVLEMKFLVEEEMTELRGEGRDGRGGDGKFPFL